MQVAIGNKNMKIVYSVIKYTNTNILKYIELNIQYVNKYILVTYRVYKYMVKFKSMIYYLKPSNSNSYNNE